jgi:hypothetical protein
MYPMVITATWRNAPATLNRSFDGKND